MTDETPKYPGELASAAQLCLLADEYRRAALELVKLGRSGEPLSRAPFRLVAIHAIELYLSALLRHRGHSAEKVRGLQHNMRERVELAQVAGLQLRTRTLAHLCSLSESREYLVARYGPELASVTSEITRLTASVDEVAKKVTTLVQQSSSKAA